MWNRSTEWEACWVVNGNNEGKVFAKSLFVVHFCGKTAGPFFIFGELVTLTWAPVDNKYNFVESFNGSLQGLSQFGLHLEIIKYEFRVKRESCAAKFFDSHGIKSFEKWIERIILRLKSSMFPFNDISCWVQRANICNNEIPPDFFALDNVQCQI